MTDLFRKSNLYILKINTLVKAFASVHFCISTFSLNKCKLIQKHSPITPHKKGLVNGFHFHVILQRKWGKK